MCLCYSKDCLCVPVPPLTELQHAAEDLVKAGVRSSTQKTYSSGEKRYIQFCAMYSRDTVPCSEDTALLFIAYLHRQGLSASSIRVYMAAVRSMHINAGHGNPLEQFMRVHKALRALDINAPPPKQKLPITLDILERILPNMDSSGYSKSLWAAMTLAFFGCLRASELTVSSSSQFNPVKDITNADVKVYFDHIKPYVTVLVKRSKTDKFNKGFHVMSGCSNHKVCCYCAIVDFIAWKTRHVGYLPNEPFFNADGVPLSKDTFTKQTRLHIAMIGLDPSAYSGHSYRSGSATSAAMAGLSDWEIKLLGRWSSDAYHRYIRAPPTLLQGFALRITMTNNSSPFSFRNPYITNVF